jgi:hypothetical protein
MSAADRLGSHLDGLSAQDRRQLETWAQAFGQGWDERRWAKSIGKLPAGPLRRPALIEMAKIDLIHRWQNGDKVALAFYLNNCPDLATNGLPPLDLLATEEQVRKQFGNDGGAAALAEPVPACPPAETPPSPPPDPTPAGAIRADAHAAISPVPPTPPAFMTAPAERRPHRQRTSGASVRTTPAKWPARSGGWMWWAAGAVIVACLAMAALARFRGSRTDPTVSWPSTVETKPAEPLRPDDPVRTISVKLVVGSGSGLTERVGLDLGLGFPLWLDPIGTDPTRPAPFGAMPQQGPAEPVLKAGSEATFTFAAAGDPGRDVLHTSQQLLAGVSVGDIRRVAFLGPVTTDWELAAYEVKVNGRTVAAGTPHVTPRRLLDKTLAELAEVGKQDAPLEPKHAELRDRVRAKLEARLQGKAPWFIAANPELPMAPAGEPVRSVWVTVLTRPHEGADTRNYVYVTFGAAKYLLGSPAKPLTSAAGPQHFELDLAATPLWDTSVRACALGMLAHSEPQGDVPDRWHPQRLIVEMNGAVIHDSDKFEQNRWSLNAIRLVPPAQIDWTGTPRDYPPTPREVSVWAIGSGAGLYVKLTGQPLPMATAQGAAPKAEPGTIDPSRPVPSDPGFTENAPNFPGEVPIVVVPPPEPDGPMDPAPASGALQVRDVRITDGVRIDDPFTVRWGLAGNEAAVDHYEVFLVRLRPEHSPRGASGSPNGAQHLVNGHVPRGVRSITAMPAGLADSIFDPLLVVRPLVRAVSADAADKQPLQQFGPAKAVFPRSPVRPQLALKPLFWVGKTDAPPATPPIESGPPSILTVGRPAKAGPAIWPTGPVGCNGVIYSGDGPTPNIAMRLDDPAEQARIWLRSGMLPPTKRERDLTAHVGFAGETPGQVDVRMSWYATPPGPGDAANGVWQTIAAPGVLPLRMALPPEAAPTFLTVRFDFRKSTGGPASRPTLIGVRLVERP